MNALKLGIGMLAVIVAAALLTPYRSGGAVSGIDSRLSNKLEDNSYSRGFVTIPMPDGLPSESIVIFAPKNCPSDAARRAKRLAEFLEEKGIGFTR